jgi:protocatechuate 3,4-dioxygenase beta subunit
MANRSFPTILLGYFFVTSRVIGLAALLAAASTDRALGLAEADPGCVPTAGDERSGTEKYEYAIVRGFVIDRYGSPVSGALVVIKGANRFATTNGEGYYVIKPVPAGTFEMKASRLGYDDVRKADVKVTAGYITNVNFILGIDSLIQDRTKGLVEGHVVDTTGYPLKRVRVRVLRNEESAETDENGAFSVGPLEPGFYSVRAECAGYLFQTGRVLVVGGEVTPLQFVLWADPRLSKFGL